MASRRVLLAVGVALTLVLAGCAGVGGNGEPPSAGANGQSLDANVDATAADANAVATGGDGRSSDGDERSSDAGATVSADVRDRAIVKEGSMTVEVENYSDGRAAIASRARSLGGFVGGSHQRLHRDGDRTWRSGYVVVRVPSGEYATMQNAVAERGTVVRQRTETTDVTDRLVDLEARIENLERRRDRLRTFYERANDTEALLRIEAELSEVQGEIERLRAQKRSLERRVAYSTLRVELREPAPTGSVETQYYERSLVGTFMGSVGDLYRFGRGALVTAAAVAPWLLVLAVPVGLLGGAYRRGVVPSIGGTTESDGPAGEPTEDTVGPSETANRSGDDRDGNHEESASDSATDDG